MSERKKKYISYKEANKRPPVILSKNAEYNPDSDSKSKDSNRREKSALVNEKDSAGQSSKQPTILIKTRDDQRSSSPKRPQNKENECGNTQKSSSGSAVSENSNHLSTVRMKQTVKLIDSNLEFNTQALDYLSENQNDYLVVGIIGTQGVGKSTLLNLIATGNTSNLVARVLNRPSKTSDVIMNKIDNGIDSRSSSDIYSEHSDVLSNSELGSDRNSSDSNSHMINEILSKKMNDISLNRLSSRSEQERKNDANEFTKFEVQSDEQLQIGQHCTNGVDMYITTNRMILLDTQPLLSASVMDKLMTADNKTMPTESAIELDSLYITSFVLSVCHVVVVVQDWFLDTNIVRFLFTADMLKPSTSVAPAQATVAAAAAAAVAAPNEESTAATAEHCPHILLLHNKATISDFTASRLEHMTQVYDNIFNDSKLRVRSNLDADFSNAFSNKTTSKKSHMVHAINLYLFPEVLPDYENEHIYKGHDTLEHLVRILRQKILGAARMPIGHSVLSEKHWGHFAAKSWEGIKKSSFYIEYMRMLT